MKKFSYFLILIILTSFLSVSAQSTKFVQVKGKQFIKDNKPYYFLGTNAWYFMNLGSMGEAGNRARLLRELDELKKLGIENIRIMAATEGPDTEPSRAKPSLQPEAGKYNEAVFKGLDFALAEMGKRDMVAVLCLNNFFQWSGGMSQYLSWATNTPIPYPGAQGSDWNKFMSFSADFFANTQAKELFKNFVKKIVTRKNSITGKLYIEDPSIMAWQLANEPRGRQNIVEYIKWADDIAGYIHSLDKNHLVSLGGEGQLPSNGEETAFNVICKSKNLDYLTMHLWIENWGWYQPQKPETYEPALKKAQDYVQEHIEIANKVNKPLVMEEFGISRDNGDFGTQGTSVYREKYYKALFDKMYEASQKGESLVGCNFWAWSGEGKPKKPGEMWQKGDDLTGDPPHESQGWYAIYSSDQSTLEMISRYANQMKTLDTSEGKK
jgi:mannan endo-1,4-beta-mannosidase